MAQTTTVKRAKAPTTHARPPVDKSSIAQQKLMVDKTVKQSDEVLKSLESAQRAAIDAVRRFVETVDEALTKADERLSRRETIVEAALDMADKLVTAQYDFLREVVHTADRMATKPVVPKR